MGKDGKGSVAFEWAHVEVVVAAGQVSIQHVKVFTGTGTDVSKDVASVCGHRFEAWHVLHVSWTQ